VAQEYVRAYTRWFSSATDESQLRGEDNLLRYRPLSALFVVADEDLQVLDLALIALGAVVTQCPLVIHSLPGSPAGDLARALGGVALQNEEQLAEAIEETTAERIRSLGPLYDHLLLLVRQKGLHTITGRPAALPRFELLHTLREQSVSVSYHRYGHLGLRGLPKASPT
jgi:RHH-type proline utilization regulon transcriptional repressor/proline dehydrogenase/delta 1-pyrroline-5-carboxylate dehydrogenase